MARAEGRRPTLPNLRAAGPRAARSRSGTGDMRRHGRELTRPCPPCLLGTGCEGDDSAVMRKFRSLWRWCLILAVLANATAPAWAGAEMATAWVQRIGESQLVADVGSDAGAGKALSVRVPAADCDTAKTGPRKGGAPAHDDCDCSLSGACGCPCTLSVKLIDARVAFAARHLLSASPIRASWESVDPGLASSVFRPPIA